jgi:O-antigen/teichoic acid export membrane protein
VALLRFSLLAASLSLGLTLLYQADVAVLGLVADARSTGQYRAAKSFAEILFFLPLGIQLLLMHHVAAAADDGAAAVRSIARRPSVVSGLLSAWGGAIAFANAGTLLTLLFGSEFGAASAQAQVLIPSVIALGVSMPLLATLQGLGKLRPALTIVLVMGALSVVGTTLALKLLGPSSVAYATGCVYFATAAGLWAVARSRNGLALSRAELAAIAAVFVATLIGARLLPGTGLVPLISVSVSATSGTLAAIAAYIGIRFGSRIVGR